MIELTTGDSKVSLSAEVYDSVPSIIVRHNGKVIADFDICMVWDDLVNSLSFVADGWGAGLARRKYEASNVKRLSEEFLQKNK